MYAAAGGLSLARRQDRRNVRKQHHTQDAVHQNLQKRFNQLQHQHAPASTADQLVRQSEHHNILALKSAGLDSSSRLPSYVDLNRRITSFGSADILEGKAATAWLEKERRGISYSVDEHKTRPVDPHRRWTRRNRIQDSSYGGSSSEEDDFPGTLPSHQSSAANMLLYVGLGTVAIGLVIGFVGTGEKGFKTLELRLIGPTLMCSGVLCCFIRILLCLCPSRCIRYCFRNKQKKLSRKDHSIGVALNRHNFPPDKQTDYYKYLPFAVINENPDHFILLKNTKTTVSEKHSLIKPSTSHEKSKSNVAIPHINVLNASSLDNCAIDSMTNLNSTNFEDDLHSLNSSYENLIIKNCSSNLESTQNVSTLLLNQEDKLKLARLKSTLTFPDEDDNFLSGDASNDGLYFQHNLSSSCEDCHLSQEMNFEEPKPPPPPPPVTKELQIPILPPPQSSTPSVHSPLVKINSSQKTVCFKINDERTAPVGNELVLSADSLQPKLDT